MKVQKLSIDQIEVMNSIIEKIREHSKYDSSIREAVETDRKISLNYHIHPNASSYCVSILTEKIDLLTLTQDDLAFIEIAHIKGIGKQEEDCVPLMSYLGKKLKEIYKFKSLPDVYLNGILYLKDD